LLLLLLLLLLLGGCSSIPCRPGLLLPFHHLLLLLSECLRLLLMVLHEHVLLQQCTPHSLPAAHKGWQGTPTGTTTTTSSIAVVTPCPITSFCCCCLICHNEATPLGCCPTPKAHRVDT
jgi:hypothetical protein